MSIGRHNWLQVQRAMAILSAPERFLQVEIDALSTYDKSVIDAALKRIPAGAARAAAIAFAASLVKK